RRLPADRREHVPEARSLRVVGIGRRGHSSWPIGWRRRLHDWSVSSTCSIGHTALLPTRRSGVFVPLPMPSSSPKRKKDKAACSREGGEATTLGNAATSVSRRISP
ncbi:unnamed protein product, partial [Scytosiphon promiscuus]